MGQPKLDPIIIEFAKLIASNRKKQAMTYEQLSKKAGVHRTTISLLERQKYNPTLQMCIQLAKALDISVSKLIVSAEKKSLLK